MGSERRVRKRGVRASRTRLSQALAGAGLKTQSALAERMADLEDLEAPPRDLVGRVFREMPVEPQSLERVARALGVKAHTLYLSSAELASPPQPAPADAGTPARKRRTRRPWRVAVGTLALVTIGAAALLGLPPDTPVGCGVHEFLHPPRVERGRLGIAVARFANDPSNAGQYFLANDFVGDARLDPYVSVVTTCEVLSIDEPGNVQLHRREERERGRALLRHLGAQILLWGRVAGDRLEVRFVSTREGNAPITLDIGGRPVPVQEARLEIPLVLSRPSDSLPDIKKAALELMSLDTPAQAQLRARAMRSYTASIDWLRAAVVGSENLRRSINARLDPQRWAAVNSDLCYNYRLLGDYDASAAEFHSAEEACTQVLEVRPKTQFPLEWAQAQVNLASVFERLHLFSASRTGSIARLRQAETSLLAADKIVRRELAPQLWAIVQRNLGIVYVRLAELTEGPEADRLFKRGIALTKASLAAQNPAFQPLDWAITQQNLCLALHELAERRGAGGVPLARHAIEHCREALRWLSPEQSALDWAMAENNLAISEAVLAQLNSNPSNLTTAIASFQDAESVYTRRDLPVNWAMVEVNLGELYCHAARLDGDASSYDPAVAHTDQALEVFISRRVGRYRRYAESQLAAVKACQAGDMSHCGCGGN